METRQGKIEQLNMHQGFTKGKQWTRYELIISGLKYSTFMKEIVNGLKIGDFVEMTGVQGEQYWTLKTMKKIDDAAFQRAIDKEDQRKGIKDCP